MQDSNLVGRGQRLNRSDVDIVFAKTRTKGERVLNFEQFVEALDALGQRCNYSLADVASQVLECGGPITRGTVAEGVRFYDDKARPSTLPSLLPSFHLHQFPVLYFHSERSLSRLRFVLGDSTSK